MKEISHGNNRQLKQFFCLLIVIFRSVLNNHMGDHLTQVMIFFAPTLLEEISNLKKKRKI